MSKVKLTHDQAHAIEKLKTSPVGFNFWIEMVMNKGFRNEKESLNDLKAEEFARAWIEGYEIEPQFKEGDVVVLPELNEFRVVKSYDKGMIQYTTENFGFIGDGAIRHATELEKQLFELGREEPKLVEGDLIIDERGYVRELLDVYPSETVADDMSLLIANKKLTDREIEYIYPIETRIKVGDNQ